MSTASTGYSIARLAARGWLEPELARPGGRHVEQDKLLAHLVGADILSHHLPDSPQPLAFLSGDKGCLELADEDILEVRQRPARFHQPGEGGEDAADLFGSEVVQRQTG